MAAITVVQVSIGGLVNPTFTAATAAGDTFTNDGNTIYIIKNGGGAITATFDDTGSISPVGAVSFDADVDVAIGASEDAYIGQFTLARFGTSVTVTLTSDTTVTVAAMRI